jgi:hypothetical protein
MHQHLNKLRGRNMKKIIWLLRVIGAIQSDWYYTLSFIRISYIQCHLDDYFKTPLDA